MDLANTYHFAASISWHTSATKVLTPYTIDGVRNIEPDIPALIIEPIVKKLPTQPNGRRFKMVRKLYSVDGVDQDWHFHTHGTLAYLLEGSHFNTLNWDTAQASIKGAHPFFEMVLDRVVDGPMIYGEVVDESGWPLEAVITIDEVKTFEGEIWTSRASDGRFDRMLHKGGRYTVRAVYEGTEIVQELDVKETGWTEVTLVVPTYGDPDMRTSALGF